MTGIITASSLTADRRVTTDALPKCPTPPSCSLAIRRNRRRIPGYSAKAMLIASLLLALSAAAAPSEQTQAPTQPTQAAAPALVLPASSVEQAQVTAPAEAPVRLDSQVLAAPVPGTAPAPTPATPTPASAPAHVDSGGLSNRAAEAATATLAALLPRLASNDTLPLLDRSVLLAGDLSRLLQHYQPGTGPAGNTDATSESATGKVRSLLERATALLGTPYRWGGTSPDSGFDCSGLVSYVFRTALGIELPRISRDMARQADAELIKNREDLQQGDLVFFGRRGRVDHVGIYVGEGQFVHAPSRGKDVRVDSITGGYWGAKFMQARRVEM